MARMVLKPRLRFASKSGAQSDKALSRTSNLDAVLAPRSNCKGAELLPGFKNLGSPILLSCKSM